MTDQADPDDGRDPPDADRQATDDAGDPTTGSGDPASDTDGDGEASDGIEPERFYGALESVGRPVATADELARELEVSQAAASDLLADLVDRDLANRVDVSTDPVVWYPEDLTALTDRERVVTFPDSREIVVDQPDQFTLARLSTFARLVTTTGEGAYRYEIRDADVWAAPQEDLGELLATVRSVLGRWPSLEEWITDQYERTRKFRLRTEEDYTVLEGASEELMGNVARQKLDDEHLHGPISDTESWVVEGEEAEIKRILYDAGYPVRDDRDLDTGEALPVDLQVELRDYQRDWVDRFLDRGAGVMVGPPGSGKTVAAMGAMAEIEGETLILVPSRELAGQWKSALVEQTTLEPEQIGEYHGGSKQLKPVTIATYRTAGMDRHRQLFDARRWGLIVYDECLSKETVIETLDGRTTFEELDDENEFDTGWNRRVDLRVRTFHPESGNYVWDDVKGVYKTESPVQRIETNTGHTLRATPEHVHLVFDPDTGEISGQRGISEGDFIVQPTPEPPRNPPEERRHGNPKAELIGWFIGDGHLNQYGDIKFSFAKRAERQIEIIGDLCDRIGTEYSIFENSRGDLTLWAPKLQSELDWQGEIGNKTSSVSVPDGSYNWSTDRIGALLRGLFDADGSVDQKNRIEYNTTSKELASDVVVLLQKLGIPSRRLEIERDHPDHSTVHRLTVPSFYNDRFERSVGFRLQHKATRVEPGTSPAFGLPVGVLLEQIKSDVPLSTGDIAEMTDLSVSTIGDVIAGRYNLGQHRLTKLSNSLDEYATSGDETASDVREKYNITYRELGEKIGTSSGGAHQKFSRSDEEARRIVQELAENRRENAAEYAGRLSSLANVTVFEVVAVETEGVETVYDLETESNTFIADGFLTHNCQHIPSPIYRRSADLQSKHRLGLTAVPAREDDRETEIFTLVGPPIGTDWTALFEAGYVARPEVEIRYVPWGTDEAQDRYAAAEGHERRQAAAHNPAKIDEIRQIRRANPDAKALVFVDWLDQGREIAAALDVPFVSGDTRHARRAQLFEEFRQGERDLLVLSRVGDEGIDLPDAQLAIVASGLGGSRRQGTQRAGRTMRPVGRAQVFVLATLGTVEEDFARRRMRHLAGKGVRIRETDARQ